MLAHKFNFYSNKGFSLIELAIVLVIIGVLIGSFVGTLSARIDNKNREDTLEELNTIKTALLGYAYTYTSPSSTPYLPCPDCVKVGPGSDCLATMIGDGDEDRKGTGECYVLNETGAIPWRTLGLGRGDAWGTRYRYWVDPDFVNDNTGFDLSPSASGDGKILPGTGLPAIANNLAVVIFSHGKNGYGGVSVDNIDRPAIPAANLDEDENNDNDDDFVSRPQTDPGATIAGGPFDDIVIWISEYELKAKMVEAGKLPAP